MNTEAVSDILANAAIPVQVGGGVRTLADVRRWLEAGVSRVILGTAAVEHPDLVRQAAAAFPEQGAVAIDMRHGKVAVAGWVQTSDLEPTDLARRFEDAGVAALIVTDIGRDGTLTGVNVEAAGAVADAIAIPVIASGGVAGVGDIERLRRRKGAPIAGAVLGKALYTGALDARQALAAARG